MSKNRIEKPDGQNAHEDLDAKMRRAIGEVLDGVPDQHQSEAHRLRKSVPQLATGFVTGLAPLLKCGISPSDALRDLRIALSEGDEASAVKPNMFRDVPMPNGLTNEHLAEAMDYTTALIAAINRDMREGVGQPLINFIQANNFSGIVSNILTDALNRFSPYKHNHDQRYPDLKNAEGVGLEMKAANKAGKGGESHNAHGGWHLIACFDLDKESGNVQFLQIEIADLVSYQDEEDGDWHYCGSERNSEGSQRTETYYTTSRGTWKLRDGSAYLDSDLVNYSRWRRAGDTVPRHSPLFQLHTAKKKSARRSRK